VTLNDLERRNSPYFAIFLNWLRIRYFCRPTIRHSDWSWAHALIVWRISSSTFGQNWPTLQRGLSAVAELLLPPSGPIILFFVLNSTKDRMIGPLSFKYQNVSAIGQCTACYSSILFGLLIRGSPLLPNRSQSLLSVKIPWR